MDVDDTTKEIARVRGVEWARQMRTIITPSSSEWPWTSDKGLELASSYVQDLTDQPEVARVLAIVALESASQSWAEWRRRSPRGIGVP